jgi:hypothetical protein
MIPSVCLAQGQRGRDEKYCRKLVRGMPAQKKRIRARFQGLRHFALLSLLTQWRNSIHLMGMNMSFMRIGSQATLFSRRGPA